MAMQKCAIFTIMLIFIYSITRANDSMIVCMKEISPFLASVNVHTEAN